MRFILMIIFCVECICCTIRVKDKLAVNTSEIKVNLSLRRFDVDFHNTTAKTLQKTKNKYPFLFAKNIPDSIWINKIKDRDEHELYRETQKVFGDFSSEKQQLTDLFKHIKYYYPKFKSPEVITLLSDIDYNNRVIYADSLLLISLDVYLGKNHRFYANYPKYIKQNNRKEHLIVDIANSFIDKQIPPTNQDRTFIGKMIYQGKKMYLLDAYLPTLSDAEKIGYSKKKLQYARINQQAIWRFFIENDLLYSTDSQLDNRFLKTTPFSKFYSAEDNLSPGRIGIWVGWQIVRSYMTHNAITLPELLQTKAVEIFKKSKYKPKKL